MNTTTTTPAPGPARRSQSDRIRKPLMITGCIPGGGLLTLGIAR
jgi:hypothetical protein